ncbi:MAG: hypothetical protein PHQ47_02440 [Candidatus Portnoybacteria bacterium]|nr:hypothetical protein [Candidatus Portnoybacteria bacterium]
MLQMRCEEIMVGPDLRFKPRKPTNQNSLICPAPKDALRGLEGMEKADSVLKELQILGVLFGGLAKGIWTGMSLDNGLSKYRDVDVQIPWQQNVIKPERDAGKIDWWFGKDGEWPSNSRCRLYWGLSLKKEVNPGLYTAAGFYPAASILLCECGKRISPDYEKSFGDKKWISKNHHRA